MALRAVVLRLRLCDNNQIGSDLTLHALFTSQETRMAMTLTPRSESWAAAEVVECFGAAGGGGGGGGCVWPVFKCVPRLYSISVFILKEKK